MAVQANRPQYAGGTVVPEFIDSTTREFSRGLNPVTGAKGAEPTEPAPVKTSVSPSVSGTAGLGTHTLTGTNLGGTTAVTVGGTPATDVVVVSETELTFKAPAKSAGTHAIALTNPLGGAGSGSASIVYS